MINILPDTTIDVLLVRKSTLVNVIYTCSVYCIPYSQNIVKTRMHSTGMRTARSLPYGGWVSLIETPWTETPPGQRPPRTETPQTETPQTDPPGSQTASDIIQRPDRCKNITLPQTSFVGSNYIHLFITM